MQEFTRTATPLAAHGVAIGYDRLDVVSEVDVSLAPGSVTAFVGPNGSGKSTLLRGLSRLQKLSQGSVCLVGGQDVTALNARDFARRVTMLSQTRPTLAGVNVWDAVEFGRHPHRSRWRGSDPDGQAAVEHALDLTGVGDLRHRTLDELSGGQVQRVWFASAAAQDTSVLLLDEPTNHLDLRYQVEVLELVRRLADQHRVTVGVVLHDLNQASAVADRVVVMSHGRVVAEGPPAEALTSSLLSQVYEIGVEVHTDPVTDAVQVDIPRQRLGCR